MIGVKLTNGKQDIILGTEQGKAMRFSEEDVRTMGRVTHGVKGITLKENDKVRDIVIVDEQATLLTVCEKGFGNVPTLPNIPLIAGVDRGVINIKTTERNGKVVSLIDVRDEDELIMITARGQVIRTPVNTLRTIGRNTQGVTLFSIEEGDKLVSVARVVPEETKAEGGAEETVNEVEEEKPTDEGAPEDAHE